MTQEGLSRVLAQTTLCRISPQQITAQPARRIFSVMIPALRRRAALKHLADRDLQDIAFGILLGYPDEAILNLVQNWDKSTNPFVEPFIDADIRGAGYYNCPQPVYAYQRHLVNNKAIQRHQKQWSQILQDFYTSDFHQKLAKQPVFQRKAKQLKLF